MYHGTSSTASGAGWFSRLHPDAGAPGLGELRRARERQREHRPAPLLALHGDVAAHREGEITADGEAEPDALARARESLVDLHERVEDRLQLVRRDPDTTVTNTDRYAVSFGERLDLDVPAWRRELDRIGEQVDEDLRCLLDVGLDGEVRIECVNAEVVVLRLELRCDEGLDHPQQSRNGDRLDRELHVS